MSLMRVGLKVRDEAGVVLWWIGVEDERDESKCNPRMAVCVCACVGWMMRCVQISKINKANGKRRKNHTRKRDAQRPMRRDVRSE